MKQILLTILLAYLSFNSFAHEGEDHGAEKKVATGAMKYFSSEAHCYSGLVRHIIRCKTQIKK